MEQILECIPNFSEGRDRQVVEAIADCFRGKPGVKLLDYSSDKDHNRSVITAAGEPQALKAAMVEAAVKAVELIDLRKHSGRHPRMGAVDVVPFVPIKGMTLEEADRIAKEAGSEIAARCGLPVYLYERSATMPHRENLADIRKGQFEGLAEKMADKALWTPDFGPCAPHESAGAVAVGARIPLIAYNVFLDTPNVEIAKKIAGRIRERDGGLPGVKALGMYLEHRNLAQVSMNLVNYHKTGLYEAFQAVCREAERLGVHAIESELIGLVPMEALTDCAKEVLKFSQFGTGQVLENRLWE